ncbi:MAG TPA: ECF transporter S component [Conexivisphaerales archaeon]|nr:ECF transporter S component [Conexivisphaerales archaeon]
MDKAGSSRNRMVAYSAMFAAFYALGRLIPFSQFIGASGFVPLSNSFILLYALLLGPVAGPLSAALGTIISYLLGKTPIFLGLDFLTPLAGVLVAGLMVRRRHLVAVLLGFALLLLAFNLSPITLVFVSVPLIGAVPWTWLHMVALAVLLLYIVVVRSPVSPTETLRRTVAKCGAAAFVGLLFQQLVGDLLFEATYGLYGRENLSFWYGTWRVDFLLYPWEWLSFAIISVVIAVPVYRVVSRRFWLPE